jgi:hypothetical protein
MLLEEERTGGERQAPPEFIHYVEESMSGGLFLSSK